jgi:DNA-binding transcriptional LysR family regulator
MDRYQSLRVFVGVVDAGSFVAAADLLAMSKAAVSRHVADLERRLGVRLLHRTTRRLSLTQEGELFLARARAIQASLDAAESELSTRTLTVEGRVKVSVPVSFGIRHLAPLWAEFLQAHPGASLDVQLADRVVDLVDEGFDLAVRIARLPDSSLVSRKLATTRLVLCASPAYLRRQGRPRQPGDLARHTVIGYSLMAGADHWTFTGPDGPVAVKVQPRLWTNNGDTCLTTALQGAGLQLQPDFLVGQDLASGRLVEVLPRFRGQELGIYAVYPTRQFVLPKVRALVDFLAARLEGASWQSRRDCTAQRNG